jgi:hypothetical protein
MPETVIPPKTDGSRIRERINRSLDAAIEEADRVGYISADDNRRHMREFMERVEQRVAIGEVKP